MPRLDERFRETPSVRNAGGTQTSNATVTAKSVTGSVVQVPPKPPAGLTFRFKIAGTKSATNAAHVLTLVLGSTVLLTLTSAGTTAVDWVAEMTVRFSSATVQKCAGFRIDSAAAVVADYAAGAVDVTHGATLQAKITSGHTSDTVTAELVSVESWVM